MRLVVSCFLFLFFALPVFSQTDHTNGQRSHDKHEEIQAIKAAYISKKVSLTAGQATAFWPVYNDYQKEVGQLIRRRRENFKNKNGDANEKLDDDLDFEARILDLKKKYKTEFSKILPPDKIYKLYRAEREWKEYLIQQLNDRRKN